MEVHTIRIGVIGDFNSNNSTHIATNDGIQHAAHTLGLAFDITWLATDQPQTWLAVDGLFGAPGSPYRSTERALEGIRCAREKLVPFLGTCGGFQHLILEYARTVLGLSDAAHAETDPYASCLFITPLSCSLVGKTMGVVLKPGSRAATAYGSTTSTENYYCNFGLNPEYRRSLEQSGLAITGEDEGGEARIAELPSHPFFMGTLFVPQARSTPGRPHPIVLEFCRAAAQRAAG